MDDQGQRRASGATFDDWAVVGDSPGLHGGTLVARPTWRPHTSAVSTRPHVSVPRPTPIDWTAPPLLLGDPLSRSRLATTIAVRLGARRGLGLVATALTGSTSDRRITVTVHGDDRRKPIRLRFTVGRGAFDVDLLRAVFDVPSSRDDAAAGFDDPRAAVDALEWALDRHDLALSDHRWAEGR